MQSLLQAVDGVFSHLLVDARVPNGVLDDGVLVIEEISVQFVASIFRVTEDKDLCFRVFADDVLERGVKRLLVFTVIVGHREEL